MWKRFFTVLTLALALSACTSAPTKDQVATAVKKIIPVPFEIVQLQELKEIPGLYEVVLTVNQQPIVLYVDKKAQYALSGSLMSLDKKINLTAELKNKYLKK